MAIIISVFPSNIAHRGGYKGTCNICRKYYKEGTWVIEKNQHVTLHAELGYVRVTFHVRIGMLKQSLYEKNAHLNSKLLIP